MRSKIRCNGESCKVLKFWMQLNKGLTPLVHYMYPLFYLAVAVGYPYQCRARGFVVENNMMDSGILLMIKCPFVQLGIVLACMLWHVPVTSQSNCPKSQSLVPGNLYYQVNSCLSSCSSTFHVVHVKSKPCIYTKNVGI